MGFSYDRTWADATALSRANISLILAIAGMFIFLPAFALFLFAPMPDNVATGEQALQLLVDYYRDKLVWFVLINVIGALGQAAIFALLLDGRRPTVGESLKVAIRLLPVYFVAEILGNIALGAGLALLIVPGIYLLGRLATVGPMLVARRATNPLTAIGDGWRMTEGRGWRIAGLVVLVGLVGWIVLSAVSSVLIVVGSLAVPEGSRTIVAAFANALSSAGLSVLMIVLAAAIYRQLDPSKAF